MSFAKDFAWGVATAAYQIEGGAYAGDKGLNVWDVGSATKGRIFEGHTGIPRATITAVSAKTSR